MPDYYFNKISGLQPAVLLSKFPAQIFLVIILKFFRTATFKKTTEQLLLEIAYCNFHRFLNSTKWLLFALLSLNTLQ